MTPQLAIKELDWYFGAAESQMGLKSNFGSMLDQMAIFATDNNEGGEMHVKSSRVTHWSDPFNKGTLNAVAKARSIRMRIGQLSTQHQDILYWIHGLRKWLPKEAQDLHTAALEAYCKQP